MQSNKIRVRVSAPVATVIALVVIAFVFGACANNTGNQNGNLKTLTQSPSPSPSPVPSPSPRLVPGDTIIVIKDGSVRIKPNKDITTVKCEDDGSSSTDKKYKCDVALGELGIQTVDGPTCVQTTSSSRITINERDQEIEIKEVGGKVKITFKKAHYDTCSDNPDEDCSVDAANRVKKITVDTPAFSKECQTGDKCEIWIRKK